MQARESHAKLLPLRGRHRHYSAGDPLMIRYLAILLYLLSFFSCSYELEPELSCLKEGTKILTPQGDKLIETLSIGDKVISYDGTNKITNQIIAIKKSKAKKTLKITLKNGITIEGTKEHPVFNVEKQNYIKLVDFKKRDKLQLANGEYSKIISIENKKHYKETVVYDLSVQSPYHNYFAEGVLVHNKSPVIYITPLIITLNDGSQITNTVRGGKGVEIYLSNNVDLVDVYLSGANLSNANLSYANLSRAGLGSANLSYANLSYANLSRAGLWRANLSYANLSCANLSYANLSYANLSNANLSNANLSNAILGGANLTDATLHNTRTNGIILTGAVGIDSNTFIGARP